eukprot:TRINITY_DN5759_c0_g1_i1.p1 TRINITY_DN5759_c0_g1~~TRINITY_DN5759_c0_g1_i1.p1  ORF type:complete len:267 (-),score=37.51 TRINITY_DN5759_c0_g1_i1:103-903(-)
MNMIDLMSIIPFYLEELLEPFEVGGGISALVIVRIVRLFRVFRLVKVARYSSQLPVVLRSIEKSGPGFGMALFGIFLFMCLWASAMFFSETSECYFDEYQQAWIYYLDNEKSPFQSIPDSLWWTLVTMTTCGYGDHYPHTTLGKIVAVFAMLSGILVLAFPLTILAGNFSAEYTKHLVNASLEKDHQDRKKNQIRKPKVKRPMELVSNIHSQLHHFKGAIDNTRNRVEVFEQSFFELEEKVRRLKRYVHRRDTYYTEENWRNRKMD